MHRLDHNFADFVVDGGAYAYSLYRPFLHIVLEIEHKSVARKKKPHLLQLFYHSTAKEFNSLYKCYPTLPMVMFQSSPK